jgi:hypothetical protein
MMRFRRYGFSHAVSYFLVGCSAFGLAAALSFTEAASPSTELKNMFSKMDRELCRSLSLAQCKRLKSEKKSKSNITRKRTSVKPQPRKATPVPVFKETNRDVISNAASSAKTRVPTPTLKHSKLSNTATSPTVPTPVEKKIPPQKQPESQVVIPPTPLLPPVLPLPPLVHAMPEGTLKGAACFESLAKLGVNFTKLTTNVGTGLCSVADAVQVQSITLGNDILKLSDQPIFNCGFAFKFASWVNVEASPIITTATGKKIATIGTGPGFQCRGRNGDIGAKLSEHAFGNAVDIEYMKLNDGENIDVKDAILIGAKHQPALAALRATACQYFTTVLGPGTNAAHATHFHFDLARRGKSGDFKMCQ